MSQPARLLPWFSDWIERNEVTDTPKPGKGGRRPGAGRKRKSLDGALRKTRGFSITDAEYTYLRTALEYFRALTQGAQDRDTPPERG